MSYLNNRFRAIGFAFAGLAAAFRSEAHIRLHTVIALLVMGFGWYCSVSATEWVLLLACISLVICLELVNSALERLCNRVSSAPDPAIQYIKDVAAGAVLLSCILAVITGCLVFLPHIRRWF